MKKELILLVLATILLTACQQKQQVEPSTSTNLFSSLLGKSQAEVDARIDSLWVHFFTPGDLSRYEADGEKTVYYEVGDSMGIIVDTGSNDVRTEGMSYGMMISLQLDKREVFDKLWRWAKTYMAYPEDSPWSGYFCWQCGLDGTEPTDGYTEGMAGANAVGAFALADSDNEEDRTLAREYVQRLWDVQPPTGKWRYYVGMVYFLSMLHVSGHFSIP